MKEFIQHSFSKKKLQQLLVASTFGNFIGFLVGSVVTGLFTYQVYERRALKNIFGILPREKVVVHMLPEWLEWLLATLLGFIVMELVSYFINFKIYKLLWNRLRGQNSGTKDSGQGTKVNDQSSVGMDQ